MSMTREEAIKALRLERGIEINGNAVRVAEFLQGLGVAISALRPVSREQVEKVWRGCRSCKSCRSCAYSICDLKDVPCKMCDPNAEGIVTEYKPSNFCPICGKPLTDEAVEMVMERLEALK